MIYPMVPFEVTLTDILPWFQGHGVIFMPIDALSVLCAQLTRDLLAIAKFLLHLTEKHWITIAYIACRVMMLVEVICAIVLTFKFD